MQSVSKQHNQRTPNATFAVMHYSTNQNTQQRHLRQHTQFDTDLVSCPRTSQSSQFSNSIPRPKTDVASDQSSQLVHPSNFSNPARMVDSNLPSFHLDTTSLPTPTRGRRRRPEHPLLRLSSPASSTSHQRSRNHTRASHFLSTLTIAPLLIPYFLCDIEFSINQNAKI